jgi:hypothetical protein
MKFVYGHPSDNLLDQAAITVQSGTPLTGYDVERLNNGSWAYPFKIAETSLELRFAFAAPVLPKLSILGNTNLTVAAVLHGGVAPGGSDVSAAFAIPTLAIDGFYSSPFIDDTGLSAKQYWRLVVTGNAAPIILGELHLGSASRTLDTNYELSSETQLAAEWRNVRLETAFGVEVAYQQAGRREAIDGQVGVTLAEFADLEAWHHACLGSARPTWMVPNDAVNDAWFVRLGDDGLRRVPIGAGGWMVRLPVRQLSRGLPW